MFNRPNNKTKKCNNNIITNIDVLVLKQLNNCDIEIIVNDIKNKLK